MSPSILGVALCGMGTEEFEAYGPMAHADFSAWEVAHDAAQDEGERCPGPHNWVVLRTAGGALYGRTTAVLPQINRLDDGEIVVKVPAGTCPFCDQMHIVSIHNQRTESHGANT